MNDLGLFRPMGEASVLGHYYLRFRDSLKEGTQQVQCNMIFECYLILVFP